MMKEQEDFRDMSAYSDIGVNTPPMKHGLLPAEMKGKTLSQLSEANARENDRRLADSPQGKKIQTS